MVLARKTRAPRGLSYLEVLIAAGIALTGLLGVIAMFPVAVLNMQKGIVVDTIAGVGPAALSTAPSLGATRALNWMGYDGASRQWITPAKQNGVFAPPANAATLPAYDFGVWASFCIDPRFCAEMAPATPIANTFAPAYFPYKPRQGSAFCPAQDDVRMVRLTLRRDPNSAFWFPLTVQQSRLFFKVSDDLLFTKPEDALGGLPAQQDYLLNNSSALQRRNYLADYEYIITLTPNLRGIPVDMNGMSYIYGGSTAPEPTPVETPFEYTMSAVVFYQRQARLDTYLTPTAQEPETERVLDVIRFPGNGYGGGDVIIQSRTLAASGGLPSELECHEGDYVMLSGNAYTFSINAMNNPARKYMGPQFRWYRVASVQGAPYLHSSGYYRRYLTLEGPDWPVTSLPANNMAADPDDIVMPNPNASQIPTTQMTIVSGVVGVFTKTVPVSHQ